MGGGEPETTTTEKDFMFFAVAALSPSLAALKLVDSPILFLAVFHKVLRSELAELHRVAVEAAAGNSLHLVDELRRRFAFLKLVCKYHSAAEDEVIFPALDAHVKNVVSTYSLEHRSIDDLFVSIFHYLDLLKKESENLLNLFKELIICIGTLWTSMSQHMLKEEEQIFPLLVQQFSPKEQAKLVWQYLCSVPIILLEEFLPWLTTTLSPYEKNDFLECISVIVPDVKLLQEVVISWLESNKSCHFGAHNEYGKGAQIYYGPADFKDMLKLYPPKIHSSESRQLKGTYLCQQTSIHGPIDGLCLWHAAIKRDFKEILAELHQLQNSTSNMTLSSIVIQLQFFVDILAFYSCVLDKLFYPLLAEIAEATLSPFHEHLIQQSQIEGLTKLLFSELQEGLQSNFVEMLCQELESVVGLISKRFIILEKEVISLISETCSHELQIWLLYTSLHMMPLGLLKCMVTWFSSHLSEDEYKAILNKIKMGSSAMHGPFASLLSEWIRTGCSGKISIEKFVEDLEELFSSRSYFCSELTVENSGSSCSQLDKQPSNKCLAVLLDANSTMKANHNMCNTLIEKVDKHSLSCSNSIFFSGTLKKLPSLPETVVCSSSCTSINLDLRPMDCFYFFHKALKKDLEYLVFLSGKLGEEVGILADFGRRFQLVMFLFQNHSNSEDEVAFPALESKGKLQNISHSYAIDHRLEAELFNKTSLVLDEIFRLQHQVDKLDQRTLKYSQLCLKLHNACISMCKVLSDHMYREEVELWPLFSEYFSIKEQEKILGHMLGKTKAEILQEMIPWLMESLTQEEQHAMMSLWRKATKNTKFEEWLGEWWEGIKEYRTPKIEQGPIASHPLDIDPLEVVSTYLMKDRVELQVVCSNEDTELQKDGYSDSEIKTLGFLSTNEAQVSIKNQSGYQSQEIVKLASKTEKNKDSKTFDCTIQNKKVSHIASEFQNSKLEEQSPVITQEELLAVIRRVSNDSSLDFKKKQYIMQSLLMSQWIVTQKKSHSVAVATNDKEEEALGQCPAYRDSRNLIFGCKHYKRNCKLLAPCCNKLYTCIRCHDELTDTDHTLDRRTISKMMCMKCLLIQPIGPNCSTPTCKKLSMARYYCRICKLFDDEKQIYHCPYCNLCRVGKGLGIDYFHCMNCNACMSRFLAVHVCREKCFEDNCPICHEYIFTSTSPVKALPCGHIMHSACFQDYTCTHYICPICSKSLGDMQVYFKMLDTLLAEEKIPEEYAGQTQDILCNDCEKRGTASFHWLYHKCSHCGSYNTRLI